MDDGLNGDGGRALTAAEEEEDQEEAEEYMDLDVHMLV